MAGIAKFSRLVGSLYDCVPDRSRWQQALEQFCDHFGGVLATLAIFDPAKNEARFAAHHGPAEVVAPLVTTYAGLASYYHIMPKMELDVPVNMEMFMAADGPAAYARHMMQGRFNEEWRIPHGIVDTLSLAVMKQDTRMGFFRIGTGGEHGPFTKRELDEVAILAPHIRRAVTIGDLFGVERQAGDFFRDVIDNLSSAVFVVASDLKVMFANGPAEQMLADGVVAGTAVERIVFRSHIAHQAIRKAIEAGERDEVALGTSGIGVPLAPVERPAVAHILPLGRRNAAAGFHHGAAAAIFIAAAGPNTLPAMEAIAALFGLTPAEKRVAGQVASGMTRAGIATASGVSDATVKSQLTTIYDKTGAAGQRELELLIRDLTRPSVLAREAEPYPPRGR